MKDFERVGAFAREQRHLLAIAFRITASQADAEDIVQEAWIRFAAADLSQVQNVSAWLTTVATRLCLDVLRRRREGPAEAPALVADDAREPEEVAMLAAELSAAFVVLLEELTPPQRVSLVLHDAFGTPFDEIARVLGTTEASARKLASRARRRVRERAPAPEQRESETARRVVEAFLCAAREGDSDRLVALLDPDVVRLADPQLLPSGGNQRIHGVDAVAAQTLAFRTMALRATIATIDGGPGIVVRAGDRVAAALLIDVRGERIVQYDVVADVHRLARLRIANESTSGA